jgi:hypothetical protein
MALSPLKIKITESQKQIARAAITEYKKRNEPMLGNEPPSVVGDMLVADPTDFVCLMAFAHRSAETELETFRLRTLGLAEINKRHSHSTKKSTRSAYLQLIEHAHRTFPIGSFAESETQLQRRPTRRPHLILC